MIFDFTKYRKLGVWVNDLKEAEQVRDALLKEYPQMVPHSGVNFRISQKCFDYQLSRTRNGMIMFFVYAPRDQCNYGLVSVESAHMIPFSFSNTKNTLSKAMRLARKTNANN